MSVLCKEFNHDCRGLGRKLLRKNLEALLADRLLEFYLAPLASVSDPRRKRRRDVRPLSRASPLGRCERDRTTKKAGINLQLN